MRVRCIANSGKSLPDSCLHPDIGIAAQTRFPLELGREYVVYAITLFRDAMWYYVFDSNDLPYPVWRLAQLFDVEDG